MKQKKRRMRNTKEEPQVKKARKRSREQKTKGIGSVRARRMDRKKRQNEK